MSPKRFREYGFTVGLLPTGATNSIMDVPGVRVGHVTLHDGMGAEDAVCTGVTTILPHSGDWFEDKCVAASHVINGFGKTTGLVQMNELGTLESPILLTNTFSVPAVTEGALRHVLERNAEIGDATSSLNMVVGECNDSYLNDMRGFHVRPEHAMLAIDKARTSQSVEEGAVGAGTGMRCFGWKGGIGSASRQIMLSSSHYHVGVLVLTNFGTAQDFTILGHPMAPFVHPNTYKVGIPDSGKLSDGSIMIVVATDIPFDALNLQRLAKRAGFGLARTGSIAHHGSGDIVIAFGVPISRLQDTSLPSQTVISLQSGEFLSTCFRAVVEATEEAIYNSLCMATTTVGRKGRVVHAFPMEEVAERLRRGIHVEEI